MKKQAKIRNNQWVSVPKRVYKQAPNHMIVLAKMIKLICAPKTVNKQAPNHMIVPTKMINQICVPKIAY